jgi:DNA-binding MarR family transcriptional regulator
MLDHLAGCGHVERVRSETDRRVVVSRLTPQGRDRIEAKRAAWKGRWEEALADLGTADLEAATRVLQRLGEMVENLPAQGPPELVEKAPRSPVEPAQM